MSKLQLQDAVDVGRHTRKSPALSWPRFVPTTGHHIGTACRLVVVAGSGSLLCTVLPAVHSATCMILSAVVVVAYAGMVTIHYVWYLSAHHANTHNTQQKWREAFRLIWCHFPQVAPARDDLTPRQLREFGQSLRAFVWFHRRVVLVLVVATSLALAPAFVAQQPEHIEHLFAESERFDRTHFGLATVIALVAFSWLAGGGSRKRTWHALLVFLHSPEERSAELGAGPAWLPKSPIGPGRRRRWILTLSLMGFSALQAPLMQKQTLVESLTGKTQIAITLVEAWSTGRYEAIASHCVVVSAFCLLTLWCFLFLLHFVVGPTLFHAHRILDDDSP